MDTSCSVFIGPHLSKDQRKELEDLYWKMNEGNKTRAEWKGEKEGSEEVEVSC